MKLSVEDIKLLIEALIYRQLASIKERNAGVSLAAEQIKIRLYEEMEKQTKVTS
jgi:hypothetical protein